VLWAHLVRVAIVVAQEIQEGQDQEELGAFFVGAPRRQRHHALSELA
jgi:hypothetical protein